MPDSGTDWLLPMKPERSLKRSIAQAFVMLAAILAAFFCLVSYVAVEVIESEVIDDRLEKIGDVMAGHRAKGLAYEAPPGITIFVGDELPQVLRDKTPGIHELLLEQREMQALIRDENGERYAVVQDMTQFEHLESVIFSSLGIGFACSLVLAVILGLATARRIVAPITGLADAVAASSPPSKLPGLEAPDEIGVLARAFAERTDELQRFLSRERLFTGDVSHELRTPLTIMLGAAEVLQSRLGDQHGNQEIAERIRRVAAEATGRVSALLLLSRAPGQMSMPRIALNPVIVSELDRYRPLLLGKPVACRFEESGEIWTAARPELVGIAVGNLIRNACQHTDQGEVIVRLGPDRIVIEDSGHGLPEAVVQRLFERFVQDHGDATEGHGLGLSIVKRVTEHLGWDVSYQPRETGGSRFTLVFPAASQAAKLSGA